jgi:predicted RNase H-like HicB family nuclease
MEIPVWVEPVEPNAYRALTGEPFGLAAEGASEEEAIQKVRELLAAKVAAGGRFVSVEVPASNNPWARIAGMFPDDDLTREWIQAMAENRKKIDEDRDFP